MSERFLTIGTYTNGTGSEGIYSVRFGGSGLAVGAPLLCENPSFLVRRGDLLYAACELEDRGRILTCRVEDGVPELIGSVEFPGSALCHLALSPDGRFLYGANYASGTIVCCPILPDGRAGDVCQIIQHEGRGVNPLRQEGPHAHSVNPSPSGRFLIAADLGLDKLLIYRVDPNTGKLTPNPAQPFAETAPGEGPRHLVYAPDGRHVYLATEMGSHVVVFAYDDERGTLRQEQSLPLLPETFRGENTGADIHLTPDGATCLVSNRGFDGLSRFRVLPGGLLEPDGWIPGDGKCPRNFAVSPDGALIAVAYQQDGGVRVRTMEGEEAGTFDVPAAVCVVWG